jgi:hypothetical protein
MTINQYPNCIAWFCTAGTGSSEQFKSFVSVKGREEKVTTVQTDMNTAVDSSLLFCVVHSFEFPVLTKTPHDGDV